MAKKPTFQMALRDGTTQEVAYEPIIFLAGTATHKLALLKDRTGEWIVSDPKCGAKVVRVDGTYKGVTCSSRGMRLSVARNLAIACLEELVNRIGSDRFNAVMSNPKPF